MTVVRKPGGALPFITPTPETVSGAVVTATAKVPYRHLSFHQGERDSIATSDGFFSATDSNTGPVTQGPDTEATRDDKPSDQCIVQFQSSSKSLWDHLPSVHDVFFGLHDEKNMMWKPLSRSFMGSTSF